MLPSPNSDGFVGDREGLFPLGGLSETTESLHEKKHFSYCHS